MKIKTNTVPKALILGTLAISIIIGIVSITGNIFGITTSALTYSNSTDVSFTFNPTLSISLSDTNITIDNLLPGLSSESSPITVNVVTNTAYGYSLFASVGNSTDYNTTSLVHSDNTNSNDNSNNNNTNTNSNDNNNNDSNSTYTFTSIDTNAAISDPTNFNDNTWGYSFSQDSGFTWSNYNGLPLYSTVDNNTSTNNPALLIDTKSPADSTESIDFKIAAKASTTQASGTYNNVINFYAVGKPEPHYLYDEVAKMSKGTQSAAALKEVITKPTSSDPSKDTSNSGVYEYDATVFGAASDASSNYDIYYYRGILDSNLNESSSSSYGSNGDGVYYPNYVRLDDTCWRIVRTTGSGGVKMIYNGSYSSGTRADSCANKQDQAQVAKKAFGSDYVSQYQAMRIGYTYNKQYNVGYGLTGPIFRVFGSDTNPELNDSSSVIKKYIEDTWFDANLGDYESKLEPSAGYCNDRTVYDNASSYTRLDESTTIVTYGKSRLDELYFGSYTRNHVTNNTRTLTLGCARSVVDLYTTGAATGGNKQLSHPIALLTADEVALAGSGGDGRTSMATYSSNYSYSSYLRSGRAFWLLSPAIRGSYGSPAGFVLAELGALVHYVTSDEEGVRPVISLRPGTEYISGTGTATDPWVVPAQ